MSHKRYKSAVHEVVMQTPPAVDAATKAERERASAVVKACMAVGRHALAQDHLDRGTPAAEVIEKMQQLGPVAPHIGTVEENVPSDYPLNGPAPLPASVREALVRI